MTKTKVLVKTLLLLCALLFSIGCAANTRYVHKTCDIVTPPKTPIVNCAQFQSDMIFAECARSKFLNLEADYSKLLAAFEACK